MNFYDSFSVFKPILTDFGFFRFRCTRTEPPKVLEYFSKFCRILSKIWKCRRYFITLTLIQRGKSKGGLHESRNFKIGQNVFKQPKTIIESRPSIAPFQGGSVPGPPPGVPRWSPAWPLRCPWAPQVPLHYDFITVEILLLLRFYYC